MARPSPSGRAVARPSTPNRRDADRAWELMGGRPGAGTGRRINEAMDRHPVRVLLLGLLALGCLAFTGYGMLLAIADGPPSPTSSATAQP